MTIEIEAYPPSGWSYETCDDWCTSHNFTLCKARSRTRHTRSLLYYTISKSEMPEVGWFTFIPNTENPPH